MGETLGTQVLDEDDFFDEDNIFKKHLVGKFLLDIKFIDSTIVLEVEDGSIWEIAIKRRKVYCQHHPNGFQ